MKTLLQAELFARDFGRTAVTVADLRAWAARERAEIPPTAPDLNNFDLVHLESLLCAMERAVTQMPEHVAIELAQSIACDDKTRALINEGDGTLARWLVGADVPAQWRHRLRQAIDTRALRAIDAMTGLPIDAGAQAAVERPQVSATLATAHPTIVHKSTGRSDSLTPIIERLRKTATDPDNHAAIWNEFAALADQRNAPPPLLGFADGEVTYRGADGPEFINRAAFLKRLKRRATTGR